MSKVKGPVGKCRHCGQEFMTKVGLKQHEEKHCRERQTRLRNAYPRVALPGNIQVWRHG